MKNHINLVAIVLIFVVLGCTCPDFSKLKGSKGSPTPNGTPIPANSSDTTSKTPASTKPSLLTMEKYNRLKINMAKDEVDSILGGPGTEISTSAGGGMTFSVYKWQGEEYTSIILSFKNDKIMSKSQVGLK